MKKLILITSLLTSLLMGCSAIQPETSEASISRQVVEAIPQENGQVLIYKFGHWYPNTKGYDWKNDQTREQIGIVVVVTSKKFLVLRWGSDRRLSITNSAPLDSIDASTARWGFNTRLVIHQKPDLYDSFSIKAPEEVIQQIEAAKMKSSTVGGDVGR